MTLSRREREHEQQRAERRLLTRVLAGRSPRERPAAEDSPRGRSSRRVMTAPSERRLTSAVMAIICCWFSRSSSARVSTGVKRRRARRAARAPACRRDDDRERPSSAALKRTESGARTRTPTERSLEPHVARVRRRAARRSPRALTCSGVSPIRSPRPLSIVISISALGSLTPLYRSSTPSTLRDLGLEPLRVRFERVESAPNSLISTGSRRAGEIVDDVGENLHELDVQPRHRGLRSSPRTSSMTSKLERSRSDCFGLSRTTMSPRVLLGREKPELRAVRRDVPATSGVDARIARRCAPAGPSRSSAVPPGREVVEHERALVDLGEKAGADEALHEEPGERRARPRSPMIQRVWWSEPPSERS